MGNNTDWLSSIQPSLHFWDPPCLLVMFYPSDAMLNSVSPNFCVNISK